jgi:GT2 family glycosyltransferase
LDSTDKASLPFISVVIPAHNGTKTLPFTLFNLVGQRYPRDRFELVIVDDRSKDQTKNLVREFIESYAALGLNIRLAENTGSGAAEARNTGILLSKGEVVALTDQDVFIPPAWLMEVAKAMQGDEAGAYGEIVTDMSRFFEPLFSTSIRKKYLTANVAYRRETLLEVGMFSKDFPFYRGDSEMAYKVLEKGRAIRYAPNMVIFHPLRKFRKGDLTGAFKWSVYDPLLLKKHAKFASEDTLKMVVPGLTLEGFAFLAFVASVLIVAFLVSVEAAVVMALGLIVLSTLGLAAIRPSYRGKTWGDRVKGAFLSLLLYSMNVLGRLIGSFKYRKFVI